MLWDIQLRVWRQDGEARGGTGGPSASLPYSPPRHSQDPTAATLIYAVGAGITSAAVTRLALQRILVKGFNMGSFQLQGL